VAIYIKLHGLWNPEVQCRIHKGSPIIPIQNRINPIPRIDTYFFKVHCNIVLPSSLGPPKCLFPVGLPVKILKAILPSSILATCPAHLNLLDLITLTILDERYNLRSSSLWSPLHSPFPSLLGLNIRLRILFSNTLILLSTLNVRDQVSQPYSTTGNNIVGQDSSK